MNEISIAEALTDLEQAELAQCERVLEEPRLARGLALRHIRDRRLYRATHSTFESYAFDRWIASVIVYDSESRTRTSRPPPLMGRKARRRTGPLQRVRAASFG